ncbi:LuxR C-terminal-related transcriptional regulator [Carboxylicivirga linearis]|uniref:Regulator n=1 Tax=Carboxylicivirga linearis TaxID=1628157 RepID=A0ABS5K0F1_9BACT|nr:LuxR C-terminal-related transcriptional regulator [Carboxylicivirga linearis]MBS2100585.1 regulator [Carboxylicivirga linearis]
MKRSNIYRFSFFLYILSLFSQLSFAQKVGLPEIEYFNRRQYGAGTQNWGISQNDNDFLYFANNDGVVEFDGVSWQLHREESPFVIRSVECIDDRIYVGLFNKIGYYQYDDSLRHLVFHSYPLNDELQKSGDFWNIHQWNNKVVFQSENNLCFFEDDQLVNTISAKTRYSSSYIVNGLLLVHDESDGLKEVRGDKAYRVSGGDVFKDKMINSVMSLSDDKIVIGTMTDGLYIWDMNTIKPWNIPANEMLTNANIFSGTSYKDDFLVFGTIQSGIVILNKKGDIVMHVDKDKGLNNNTVLSVFVDKEGNIWGGLDNGIVRLNFNSSITFLQGYYDIGTGYVIKNYEGEYYMGTNQALFTIDEKTLHNPLKTRKDFKKIANSEGQVWSLYKEGNQILCGHNLGVFEVEGNNARLITPPVIKGAWLFKPVPNRSNLMLVGTYSGLLLLEKSDSRWKYKWKIEGFEISSRFMEWDKEGNLWITHGSEGIFKLNFDVDFKKVLLSKKFSFDDVDNNSEDAIVTKVADDCLFVGNQGMYNYNLKTKTFERYVKWDHFFEKGEFPKIVYLDDFQNLWYFHYGMVGVLRHMEDATYKKIDFPFKVLHNKLVNSFESILVPNNNETFFGVEDGFAHYLVDEVKNYRRPFKINIRSFKGVTDTIPFLLNQTDDHKAQQSVVPVYEFKNNSFTVQYAASYYEDNEVVYSSYLKGVDVSFTQWSNRTMREFTKLKEGSYDFVVKAKNRYGVQTSPITFSFVVLPPWYRTLTARVVYLVLILGITLTVFLIFNKRLEISRTKEKLKQRELFKEKEEALQKEALRAEKEMIKMRNEKLRNEMVHKEKELANSTMNIIRKNEFLSSLKLQLKKLKSISDKSELESKIQGLIRKIDKDLDSESYWEVFEMHLEQVHESFLDRLKEVHPDLTPREQKLAAYIRMGMSSKEIASLMNITSRAVENNRYKLRQKLNIGQGENLGRYISNLK